MKKRSWIAGLLAAVLSLTLYACGESSYSMSIRKASEENGFGRGSKIAVLDKESQKYVKKYLSATYLADTPEEVGAILTFSSDVNKQVVFVLSDAESGKVFASTKVSSSKSNMDAWIREKWPPYRTDRELRALYQSGVALTGDRLAVYDVKADKFSYSGSFLPAGLEGCSPEDVGLFLIVEKISTLESRVALRVSGGDALDIVSTGISDVLSTGGVVFDSTLEREMNEAIEDWTEEQAGYYFAGRNFASRLSSENLGGGNKIIGYDEDACVYTARFIPESLLAESPAETGLIARIHTEKITITENYSQFGFDSKNIGINTERVTITLSDAVTNSTVSETTLEGSAPRSLNTGSMRHWSRLGNDAFAAWLREQANAYFS